MHVKFSLYWTSLVEKQARALARKNFPVWICTSVPCTTRLGTVMDDRPTRRSAMPTRHGSCLVSGQISHEERTTRYPTRIGGSTRVTAVKTNGIEDKEQGQSSKAGGRLSNSKPLSEKSVLPVPKVGSSNAAKLKKACRVPSNSGASGQSSSMRNVSVGLGQLGHGGAIFQRGKASKSNRLGLAEISNLTSCEGSSCDFNFLQETPPSSSMNRSLFHTDSIIERKEPRVTSSRCLNRLGSWNEPELLTGSRRLSELIYEDEEEHIWSGTEENGTTDTGAGPSTSSSRSGFINGAPSQSIIFQNEHDSTSDDSFVSESSVAGDLFDVDAASSSDSLLCSSPLLNQRSQEQGSLRRGVAGQADNPSVSLGEELNMSRPSVSKRKTSMRRTASQVAGKSSSQEVFTTVSGPGSKERYVGRSSVGSSRRNLGSFGCTSASDALPSNSSSFNAQYSEQSGNRRPDPSRQVTDGRDSLRGQRMAKVPVASNTSGPVSQRANRSGLGISPHYQLSSTPRVSRRTVRAMQPEGWRSQEILGGETVVESGLSSESSSSMRVLNHNGMLGHRHRARSPSSASGRSAFGALQRRHDVSHGVACTLGERVANRLSAPSRGASSSVASEHLFGLAGSSSRLNSICTDLGSSSYSLLTESDVHSNMSIRSGPAPSRAPPLPPMALSVRPQEHSSPSISFPFSGPAPPRAPPSLPSSGSASLASSLGTDSPILFDGTTFGRSASGSESPLEMPLVAHSESSGHRAFRTLSIEGDRHTQHAMEGLAEVLLALERIEQDEDLTYEQVLLLEANLLFGGINLHDQHSDMRLDIDNMSYEELLALEERIGSVSTGLTEDAISKCLKRVLFASDVAVADLSHLESEVKCSVCQEEYGGGEELGRLNCDHSYHAACIKQWLLQKNQCPICKAPAYSQKN